MTDNNQLPKVNTSNMWDQTFQILKDRILTRQFGPNSKLLIPDLAEQLGVSRTPIRDALNRLEVEGLVRTVSKVGTFVNPVQEDNVLDIMNSRAMIEYWSIEQMKDIPMEQRHETLRKMAETMQQAQNAVEQTDMDLYYQSNYDLDFHLQLVSLGGNRKNVEIYKSLMNFRFLNLGEPYLQREMVIQSVQQHHRILEALEASDVSKAKEAVKAHLDYSQLNILRVIEQNGGEI